MAGCDVPLFAGKRCYWIIARTDRDKVSAAWIKEHIPPLFAKWFSEVFTSEGKFWPGKVPLFEFQGKIDHLEVLEVKQSEFPPKEMFLPGVVRVANMTHCREQNPMLRETKKPWWILVSFIWRGGDEVLKKWPAHRQALWNPWEPRDADFLLYLAYVAEEPASEPEQDLSSSVKNELREKADDALRLVKEGAEAAGEGLSKVAVILGIGVLGAVLLLAHTSPVGRAATVASQSARISGRRKQK